MTKQMLMRLGLHSCKTKHIIPRHMGHTLPRPCRINGRMAAEFLYFSVEPDDRSSLDYIKLYAAIDVITGEILRLRAFPPFRQNGESFETGYLFWRFSHGKRYLRQCAKLLSQNTVSDEEMERLQRRWLSLQPGWVRNHSSVRVIAAVERMRQGIKGSSIETGGKRHV